MSVLVKREKNMTGFHERKQILAREDRQVDRQTDRCVGRERSELKKEKEVLSEESKFLLKVCRFVFLNDNFRNDYLGNHDSCSPKTLVFATLLLILLSAGLDQK